MTQQEAQQFIVDYMSSKYDLNVNSNSNVAKVLSKCLKYNPGASLEFQRQTLEWTLEHASLNAAIEIATSSQKSISAPATSIGEFLNTIRDLKLGNETVTINL